MKSRLRSVAGAYWRSSLILPGRITGTPTIAATVMRTRRPQPEGVNLWIGYGAIYVKGGQQTRGNANEQRARASFAGGGDSGAGVESRGQTAILNTSTSVCSTILERHWAKSSAGDGWTKVHPDDVAFKVRTWLQNLESGKPHDVMCRFRGADGGYRWFEVRGEPLRASDGRVLRLVWRPDRYR